MDLRRRIEELERGSFGGNAFASAIVAYRDRGVLPPHPAFARRVKEHVDELPRLIVMMDRSVPNPDGTRRLSDEHRVWLAERPWLPQDVEAAAFDQDADDVDGADRHGWGGP